MGHRFTMYWLVALPLGDDDQHDRVWSRLQELTTYTYDYSLNFKFKIPDNLRVGTLDSLLSLSDDLIKVNAAVEGTVNKIRRQLYDLQASLPDDERSEVWVEGVTPEGYLQRFAWNEAKYPSRRPPRDTVQAIMDTVQRLDDDLKARGTEYSQARTALQALLRKHAGSLAVRDLSDVVPREGLVATENLTTMVVVVPKAAREDFLAGYEALTDLIVPRSAAEVAEDADYSAYSVVLFRRVADEFKAAARGKGYQAKELAAASAALVEAESSDNGAAAKAAVEGEDTEAVAARLRGEVERKRDALVQWCLASYGEAFSSWIHVTAVRLFVEAILRYGLPPRFLPVLMRPNPKQHVAVRKLMAAHFGSVGAHHFTTEGSGAGGGGEELWPYVSFSLNIEEHQ